MPAAVMLCLGLWGLDRGAIWRDESATSAAARRTLPQLRHLLGTVDAVHGLYYLLMHPVLALHPGEVALRLPSVLAATATAGLLGALGHRLTGRPRAGLWAGLLYAVTPMVSHYAQEGRSYALVACGAAAATRLLVEALAHRTRGHWIRYTAVLCLTVLLHACALLLLAAHAVTLLAGRTPRTAWRGWLAAAATAALALLPLALVSHGQAAQISWIPAPGPPVLRALLHDFAGPSGLVLTVNLLLIGAALLGDRVPPPAAREAPPPAPARRGAHPGAGPSGPNAGPAPTAPSLVAVALPLALVPPVLLYLLSLHAPLFLGRYLLFALAGVPLLAAAGADRLARALPWRRTATLAGTAAIAGSLLWQLPLQERERAPAGRPDDLASAAREIGRLARPGDAVLYAPSYQRRIALAYPRPLARLRDLALRTPGPASGTLYGTETGPRRLAARLAGERRIWVVAAPATPHGPKHAALRAQGFRPALSRCLPDGNLTLYVRDPTVRGPSRGA
ncbi:hypothetical protein ACZ90_50210 [Streptomyces albus subsp. albus]|nr:hypothetical protein ACZ90_50210 [Streptomyces albus subsp. albus]